MGLHVRLALVLAEAAFAAQVGETKKARKGKARRPEAGLETATLPNGAPATIAARLATPELASTASPGRHNELKLCMNIGSLSLSLDLFAGSAAGSRTGGAAQTMGAAEAARLKASSPLLAACLLQGSCFRASINFASPVALSACLSAQGSTSMLYQWPAQKPSSRTARSQAVDARR